MAWAAVATSAERCAELAVHPSLAIVLEVDEIEAATSARPILEALADAGVRVVIVSGGSGSQDPRLRARVVNARAVDHSRPPPRARVLTWPCFAADDLDELELYLAPFAAVYGVGIERTAGAVRVTARHVTGGARAEVLAELTRACDAWLASYPDHVRFVATDLIEVRRIDLGSGDLVAWLRVRAPDARMIAIVPYRLHDDFAAVLSSDDAVLATRGSGVTFLSWLLEERRGRMGRPRPGQGLP